MPIYSYSGIERGQRFVDDQRVRVVRLRADCEPELRWILGKEGSVSSFFEDGTWGVWMPMSGDEGELWSFSDEQIEPVESSEETLARRGPRVDPRPIETAEDIVAVMSQSRGLWDAAWRIQQEAPAKLLVAAFRIATDDGTRRRLAYVIGHRRLRSGVPALLEALDDPSRKARVELLDALGDIAVTTKGSLGDRLGPPLLAMLETEPEVSVRTEVIRTLGSADYLPAASVIKRHQASDDPHMRYAADYALKRLDRCRAAAARKSGEAV